MTRFLALTWLEFKSSFQPKSPEYKLEPKFNVPTLIWLKNSITFEKVYVEQ